jgi:hypothetical protein
MRGQQILPLLFILLFLLSSCSTVRLGYQGAVKDQDGNEVGSFAMEKSYSTSNMQLWCIITGIIYGGACWGYLIMPTTNQRKEFHRDALARIKEKTGRDNLQFHYDGIKKVSWESSEEFFTLNLGQLAPAPAPNPKTPAPSMDNNPAPKPGEKKNIEFLR